MIKAVSFLTRKELMIDWQSKCSCFGHSFGNKTRIEEVIQIIKKR
jgi:hypothetical protein